MPQNAKFVQGLFVEGGFKLELPIVVIADDTQDARNRETVERASALLLRDLQHPPDLAEMSRDVGLTTFQLSRLFGRTMGKSMPALLRERRMHRAGELLKATNHNIGDVAFAVGYYSISAFSRAFSREMGMTPSEFRKNPAESTSVAHVVSPV
ncbi:AraC family transcriptional regulator [Roseimicrobium sp. ORNL1]|uniref:helix-turn-helix transcriptional regulator n=1 Tax=Roseimicrobium sp. ORNL1 TaxID=2711231 RepID=UPI0013E151FE|nr:AraC family transcriptional regulator [Roseimicrobium sp. ORNL1]QIF01610.1 helix-turn-helix transcriptional regulator [Roseimicrobium sp. ORNL1]